MTELSGADLAASTPAPGGLEAFARLAWGRRTSLQMDLERDVAPELVQELCEIAASAPNHKRTWPWRFCLFTGEGRAALGAAYAATLELAGADEGKLKTRTKYLRAPAMLLVGSTSPEPGRAGGPARWPRRSRTCCSPPRRPAWPRSGRARRCWTPGVLQLAGFAEGARIVGVVYLGWPAREVESPERPPVEVGRHRLPRSSMSEGSTSALAGRQNAR